MEEVASSPALRPHQLGDPAPVPLPGEVASDISALGAYLGRIVGPWLAVAGLDGPRPFPVALAASRVDPSQGAVRRPRPACPAADEVVGAAARRRDARLLAVCGLAITERAAKLVPFHHREGSVSLEGQACKGALNTLDEADAAKGQRPAAGRGAEVSPAVAASRQEARRMRPARLVIADPYAARPLLTSGPGARLRILSRVVLASRPLDGASRQDVESRQLVAIARPDTGEVETVTAPLLADQTDALRHNALRLSRRAGRLVSSTLRPRLVDVLAAGAAPKSVSCRPARLGAIAVQLSRET